MLEVKNAGLFLCFFIRGRNHKQFPRIVKSAVAVGQILTSPGCGVMLHIMRTDGEKSGTLSINWEEVLDNPETGSFVTFKVGICCHLLKKTVFDDNTYCF